ncbi:hypothetical protein EXIGLDRAFT_740234 [Exidia glandulosa HHB12029]|uniref:Fucose-specific lectin n=1 Tax=Exidia glandulosa HHB12029 TaxID=1314781 RepID=A0A165I5T9_EXIGL|nr:hypothetical protein EXIGLDRAFT_740234 [Exidia glandulosa HHB12029]
MFVQLQLLPVLAGLVSLVAALNVTLSSNTLLDRSGIFFVSYDGLVNVNSFQASGVITHLGYQYAAWYTSDRSAMLARRALPNGAWSKIPLPHKLRANDSHNVISLGISPADGVIHVAMDCHSNTMFYTKSVIGLANAPASKTWAASKFGRIQTTLGNLNIGTAVTYPQFVVTPERKLQFVYRSGVSGNGANELAEYDGGTWRDVGQWTSTTGSYTANGPGVTSTARNSGRIHTSGTWREHSAGVSCSSGGLTNHDTVYGDDDRGRTWHNTAGTKIGTSGSSPISVSTAGIIVDPLNPDHAVMNQESQATDSQNLPHIVISYVPGRFGQCVSSYESGRVAHGRAFHLFRSSSGHWTKTEIPLALGSVGRSQIFLDPQDNVYVVLPFVRVMAATTASNYTDWALVYDGRRSLKAFGEVTLDRRRLETERIVSILFQVVSPNGSPSSVRVADLKF